MRYIGLLLNAPYKIDSMVWMSLMMILIVRITLVSVIMTWLYEPGENIEKMGHKWV
jgi:hypothetical protein